jgi:hypothetical protein
MKHFWILLILCLTGCGSGAVVFAPTPLPPDVSPLRYDHPSGAFSVVVPRNWPVFTQYATTLASASFSPPDSVAPLLTLAVVNLGQQPDAAAFAGWIDQYQAQIRADAAHYKEENRQAMGDGSWRMTGLRTMPGGETYQVNTFMERVGTSVGIVEVTLPEDAALAAALQDAINTFHINAESALEPTDLSVLVSLAGSTLNVFNVATWSTPEGVFYVTGEVANYGTSPAVDLPVRAVLKTAEGLPVAEAVDMPMGYAVLPGGFAPFSLRFGQGQPGLTTNYEVIVGSPDWQPQSDVVVYGPQDLSWIDESAFDEQGRLVVSGMVTNIGQNLLRNPRASVAVFNASQQVIAARFVDLDVPELRPNESTPFEITLPELGGEPAQYVVNIQALP